MGKMRESDTGSLLETLAKAGVPREQAVLEALVKGQSRTSILKGLVGHFGLTLRAAKELLVKADGIYPSAEAYEVALGPGIYFAATYFEHSSGDDMDQAEAEIAAFEEKTGLSKKVDALARLGRIDEATRWIDRMGPDRPQLNPIKRTEALEIARDVIDSLADDYIIEESIEHDFGWIFGYQSAAFLRTGNATDLFGGNAPVLVDRFTGVSHVTGTAEPIENYLERYRATGDPHRSEDWLRSWPQIARSSRGTETPINRPEPGNVA